MTHAGSPKDTPYRPDPMYIRRAGMQDVEAIARLLVSIQAIHVNARPDVFKPVSVNDALLDRVADQVDDPNAVTFVGQVNDVVIGYAYVVVAEKPETIFMWPQRYATIDQMGVAPDYRGLGYGELLMRRVIDFAQEFDIAKLLLDVWTFNEGAIDFYERLGFRISNHRMELMLD